MSTQRYSATPYLIETIRVYSVFCGTRAIWANGGITDKAEMAANLTMNCIPAAMQEGEVKDFGAFLEERRKLMALKIKSWFEVL